jgi:hypothetical protein
MVILQIVFAVSFFFFLYCSYKFKISIGVILVTVFFSSLILSFILRQCFLELTHTPFGPAADSYGYNKIALNVMQKSFKEFQQYMLDHNYSIDDYGFPIILYFVYSLSGNEQAALFIMLLFNTLAITLSTYYLYKLMLLFCIEHLYIRFFCAAWGFFPFLSVTSAVGLKENFFCVFIIASFYYMYKYKKHKKFLYFLLFLLFTFYCYLFRIAIPVMILLSFIILLLVKARNAKMVLNILFIGFFASIISLNILFTYIFPFSLEHVLAVASYRLSQSGSSSSTAWITQIISGLVGPFPNFNRAVAYGIIHNSGLLLKLIYSFSLWVGIWYVLKTLNYKYYALVAYIIMGMVMLILSGVSLDMRYQITFFPLMLPIIAYAFQQRIKKIFYYGYTVLSVVLIIAYNAR